MVALFADNRTKGILEDLARVEGPIPPTLIRRGDLDMSVTGSETPDDLYCYSIMTTLVALLLAYLKGMTTDFMSPTPGKNFRYQQQALGTPNCPGGYSVDDWFRAVVHLIYFMRRRVTSRTSLDNEKPKCDPAYSGSNIKKVTSKTPAARATAEARRRTEFGQLAPHDPRLPRLRLLSSSDSSRMITAVDHKQSASEALHEVYARLAEVVPRPGATSHAFNQFLDKIQSGAVPLEDPLQNRAFILERGREHASHLPGGADFTGSLSSVIKHVQERPPISADTVIGIANRMFRTRFLQPVTTDNVPNLVDRYPQILSSSRQHLDDFRKDASAAAERALTESDATIGDTALENAKSARVRGMEDTFLIKGLTPRSRPQEDILSDAEIIIKAAVAAGRYDGNTVDEDTTMEGTTGDPMEFDYQRLKQAYPWANWDLDKSNKALLPTQVIGKSHP